MAAETETSLNQDVSKMNKVQKLATLLVMLGPESAAQLLKHLTESELEGVSGEMTKITMIGQAAQREILKEFAGVAIQAGSSLRGGVEYAQNVLEKSMGQFKASNILSRVAPERSSVPSMRQLLELESTEFLNLVKYEQPQTIALVLSHMPPDRASAVLGLMPEQLREQVVERLATLATTPIEVLERVVEVLVQRLGDKHTRAINRSGGVKSAANMLNALDKSVSRPLLVSMEERNPELTQAIRQRMFTFEDIGRLEVTALQRVLREVDMADLAIALKTAPEPMKVTFLSCISKRAAETVKEEMAFMGAPRSRDVEAARLRVVEIVRRLETEGEIDLGGNDAS